MSSSSLANTCFKLPWGRAEVIIVVEAISPLLRWMGGCRWRCCGALLWIVSSGWLWCGRCLFVVGDTD
jgi:hypothetical protein